MTLCKCGCGQPVYGDNDYIHGHFNKTIDARKAASDKTKLQFSNQEARDSAALKTRNYAIDNPDIMAIRGKKSRRAQFSKRRYSS